MHTHTHTLTHSPQKNSTEHLKKKSFIYFVTTSYTFLESFHSDTTVAQDKSIWHIAVKARASIELTDFIVPHLKMLDEEILGSYFLKVYTPQSPNSHSIDFPSGKLMLLA